jgi:hypothetical protein
LKGRKAKIEENAIHLLPSKTRKNVPSLAEVRMDQHHTVSEGGYPLPSDR